MIGGGLGCLFLLRLEGEVRERFEMDSGDVV